MSKQEKNVPVAAATTTSTVKQTKSLASTKETVMSNAQIVTLMARTSKTGREYTDVVYDGEAMLGLPTKEFTPVVSAAYELACTATTSDWAGKRLVGCFLWEMKKRVRAITNNLAYNVVVSKQIHTLDPAKMMAAIQLTADRIQAFFDQYQDEALILQGLTGLDFELHPFHIEYKGDFTIDNGEEYSFTDEEDEAAAFIRMMEQSELKHDNGNAMAKAAWVKPDDKSGVISPAVDAAEWVEYMCGLSMAEWEEAASFGAWGAAQDTLNRMIMTGDYDLALEFLQPRRLKPLTVLRKAMRKIWDAEAGIQSRERRIAYIYDRQAAASTDDHGGEMANPSHEANASKDDDAIDEIKLEIKELGGVISRLHDMVEGLKKPLDIARIDGKPLEFMHYECYVTFNPIEFSLDQFAALAAMNGERFGPLQRRAARKTVIKELGNPSIEQLDPIPQVVEGVEIEPLQLWALRWEEAPKGTAKKTAAATTEEADALREADAMDEATLNIIRRIRTLRFRHAERDGVRMRQKDVASMSKHYGMRNKRKFELELDGFDL